MYLADPFQRVAAGGVTLAHFDSFSQQLLHLSQLVEQLDQQFEVLLVLDGLAVVDRIGQSLKVNKQ